MYATIPRKRRRYSTTMAKNCSKLNLLVRMPARWCKHMLLFCTVLCKHVLFYSTVLCSTVQCCTPLCCTVLCCTGQTRSCSADAAATNEYKPLAQTWVDTNEARFLQWAWKVEMAGIVFVGLLVTMQAYSSTMAKNCNKLNLLVRMPARWCKHLLLYCTVLYCAILCCPTLLNSAILYCAVLYCTALHWQNTLLLR